MRAFKALEASSLALRLTSKVKVEDEMSKAITETVASAKSEVTSSQLTRMVKALKGKALRRILSSKVKALRLKGIVAVRRLGNKVYVKLMEENPPILKIKLMLQVLAFTFRVMLSLGAFTLKLKIKFNIIVKENSSTLSRYDLKFLRRY